MAPNDIIQVHIFGQEIGKIGYDPQHRRSSFQYHPSFFDSQQLNNIFPNTGIIRRTPMVQQYSQYFNDTFHGLPPQFADSLPDRFGSIIFKTWLTSKEETDISILEQLAYISNRGMGAIEYFPSKKLPKRASIDLDEIIEVLREVLDLKQNKSQSKLDSQGLTNIFKIGTSAGGARPKILISEHKRTGKIIPGDLEYSDAYHHYLVKLSLDQEEGYHREVIEYCYYFLATSVGITMMDSKLIDDKHFTTLRFDRQDGTKQHILTATGLTGWDFKNPDVSSYENLFKLSSFLRVPHTQLEELYRRMIFNVIYSNTDDHLKNHSFLYQKEKSRWSLAPAYDLTYALNPLLQVTRPSRAMSINGKRQDITLEDVLKIADDFTIKNPKGIIREVQSKKEELLHLMSSFGIPEKVIQGIEQNITNFVIN